MLTAVTTVPNKVWSGKMGWIKNLGRNEDVL